MTIENKPFVSIIHGAFFLLCFVFISSTAHTQNQKIFQGRVFDSTTKQPLRYATIAIPNSGLGLITNQHGEFAFHIPSTYYKERVQLSFIGYKSLFIDVVSINADSIYSFQMEPEVISIDQINVNGQKIIPALEMVKLALDHLPNSYPTKCVHLNGYYRDYVRDVKTEDYDNLIEAAVQIEDYGFQYVDYLTSVYEIQQLRIHPNFGVNQKLNVGYNVFNKTIPLVPYMQQNELVILRGQDNIRNANIKSHSFIQLFGLDFLKNYHFKYNACIESDSSRIFEIAFDAYPTVYELEKATLKIDGKIYIHEKDKAIVKLEYTVNSKLPNYTGKFIEVKVEYKKNRNLYYLNYLTACNYFEFQKKTETDSIPNAQYFQYRELFVNKIEDDPIERIDRDNMVNIKYSLLKDTIPTQKGFWENYNYPTNIKLLD